MTTKTLVIWLTFLIILVAITALITFFLGAPVWVVYIALLGIVLVASASVGAMLNAHWVVQIVNIDGIEEKDHN